VNARNFDSTVIQTSFAALLRIDLSNPTSTYRAVLFGPTTRSFFRCTLSYASHLICSEDSSVSISVSFSFSSNCKLCCLSLSGQIKNKRPTDLLPSESHDIHLCLRITVGTALKFSTNFVHQRKQYVHGRSKSILTNSQVVSFPRYRSLCSAIMAFILTDLPVVPSSFRRLYPHI